MKTRGLNSNIATYTQRDICVSLKIVLRNGNTLFIPQRRGSLEPFPRGPFGLSALFRFMLLLDFFGFPLGTRATYCVVGGGWWVGRIFEKY